MFGIITDDEFEAQLAALDSRPEKSKIVSIQRGRGASKEVPIEIKKLIAEGAINGAPSKSLQEAFGLSAASISAYKHDATSTASYNEPQPELAKANGNIRERIINTSRQKLEDALASITAEKLAGAKLKDVSGVARDMSAVIKNMEPDSTRGNSLNQQFVFYAPRTKSESDFELIEARD